MSKSKNKKVLIVKYYWPPSGGSGVQRWLKFTKYLVEFGWQPFIFTPENPAFDIRDESLERDVPADAEVIRFPIWEPYAIFFSLSKVFGSKPSAKPTELVGSKKKSLFNRVTTWVRGNLLVPDPRKFWVSPSVKFLGDFLEDNAIDTIITTGPPHSIHLIGLKLKRKYPKLKWIADFRDPWSEWGFLQSINVGAWAHARHRKLERQVLTEADEVMTITPFYVRQFERIGGRPVHLLTNGFDEKDFATITYSKPTKFTIRHIGIINERCDPRNFLTALDELLNERTALIRDLVLEFIGEVHPRIRQFVSERSSLAAVTIFTSNIPHKELLSRYGSSSLLLLVLTGYKDAEGYMPGKLFEYIATGLPILALGPIDGDAANLLKDVAAGKMLSGESVSAIKAEILRQYEAWKQNDLPIVSKEGVNRYSRRSVTEQFVNILAK